MDIFQKGLKLKLRFTTNRGEASIEDLNELSLTDLDVLAKAVNKKLKEENEESFIGKKTKSNVELELKLEILKAIIATKQEEDAKSRARIEKKSQTEFLKNLLQKKKLDALESMTAEDIEKQLAALEEEV